MSKNIFGILVISLFIFYSSDIVHAGVATQGHGHGSYTSQNSVPAGGWNNLNHKVNFAENSWNTYCANGESLVEDHKSKGWWRNGTLSCMVRDDCTPKVSVNFNGYLEDTWTHDDVRMSVNLSDPLCSWSDTGMWVKKAWYSINGEAPVSTGPNYDLNFTKEWYYNVIIWAEDLSVNYGQNGASSSNGNTIEDSYTIKIDKSKMVLSTQPSSDFDWTKERPVISWDLKDTFKGQNGVARVYTCTWKPAFSSWKAPVWVNGSLYQSCNPDTSDCTVDSNFVPSAAALCVWACNTWYTKWPDNLCHLTFSQESCEIYNPNLRPRNSYYFNKGNTLLFESSADVSDWILPIWVNPDGTFTSNYNVSSNSYSPVTSQCAAECRGGFHNINGQCVNDVRFRCCEQFPLSTTNSVDGVKVDCTQAANQTNAQCVSSPLCGWSKEVLGTWNKTSQQWDYTTKNDGTKSGEAGFAAHCWNTTLFPNSDGYTCNHRYYLVSNSLWQPQSCSVVPVGEWSGQENEKRPCTNKPAHSYYTSNGDNNNCAFACDGPVNWIGGYDRVWNNCVGRTRAASCTPIPSPNATWNYVSSITQQWDTNAFYPSNQTTYNPSGSYADCRYTCASWNHWDGSGCVSNSRYYACSAKPAGSVWNNVSGYQQNWYGYWYPANSTTSYGPASNTSCNYTCAGGYNWNGSSCAPIVNGACGSSAASCSSWSVGSDSGNTACWTTRTWMCNGSNGGSSTSCSSTNAACPPPPPPA